MHGQSFQLNINNTGFKTASQVCLIQCFADLFSVVDRINKGTLQPAETEIKVVFLFHCPWEMECVFSLMS